MENNYISNFAVLILNIFYQLVEYGYVYPSDYDITAERFSRYISNIRFMMDEYHIYHMSIKYDRDNKRYMLEKKN